MIRAGDLMRGLGDWAGLVRGQNTFTLSGRRAKTHRIPAEQEQRMARRAEELAAREARLPTRLKLFEALLQRTRAGLEAL